jgi:hypothetical protein
MSSPSSFHSFDSSSSPPSAATAGALKEVNEKYSCGDRYQGTVRVGANGAKVKQGWGRYVFQNGSVYEGNWHDGTMHGKGRFLESTTSDRFEGLWDHGRRVYGVYYFHDGDLYIGGFDEATGHLKNGRCVVVEDMMPFDAVYKDDVVTRRVPFDIRVAEEQPKANPKRSAAQHTTASHVDAGQLVSVPPPLDRFAAAKIVLRTRREQAQTQEKCSSPSESKGKQFAKVLRGDVERFSHPPNSDVKDAFRFHYR